METELKFQVPAARRAALERAVATAGVQRTRLQAVYAETPGQRLAAAGLALRLRQEGRLWVQTLKGRGDGLATRLEHEVHLGPQRGVPTLDPARHAGSAAGAALAAALGEQGAASLQPLYRTDIRRLHRRVRHGGALIEIAYDRGFIVATPGGGAEVRAPVDEIEFELLSGPPGALPALAERWARRFGLWWDVRTKSERGLRLALGRTAVPATGAVAVELPRAATPAQAFAAALNAALAQALPNAAELAGGSGSAEHLHQLRVGLRRLRTVLRVLGPWSARPEAAAELQQGWAALFGALGAAREADVLNALQPELQAALQQAGIAAPHLSLPSPAAADPAALLRGPEFNRLLLQTLALAMAPAEPGAMAAELTGEARTTLRHLWRAARPGLRGFAEATPEERHRLRRQLKRLRYTLEALQALLPRKPVRELHKPLCVAVEALGRLNDLHLARGLWQGLAQERAEPAAWFAVGWLEARQKQASRSAARALKALDGAPRPWRED